MGLKIYQTGDGTYISAEYNDRTKVLNIITHEHSVPIIEANREARKDPSNGYSKKREGALARMIARPLDGDYNEWQREYRQLGGVVGDYDWRIFLRKKIEANPYCHTVEKLRRVQPNEGNIIIK